MSNIFEQATRQALRFQCQGHTLTVEDLWQLPLQSSRGPNLDDLARGLHENLSKSSVSFVTQEREDPKTRLAFEVVKHVIGVLLAEKAANEQKAANAARKQKLLTLIQEKQDANLAGMSLEDLMQQVRELD